MAIPLGGNGGIMSDMVDDLREGVRRLKVQNLTIGQKYIVDGIGFTSHWREAVVPAGQSAYAKFIVPAGFWLALESRLIKTDGDQVYYRVFPQGTFTAGANKVDDGLSFARDRNMRQDTLISPDIVQRCEVTTPPADTDFIVFVDQFGASGTSSGNRSTGELELDESFLLLMPDQTFLLEFKNNGSSDCIASVNFNYALIPEELIPNA